MRSFRLVNFLSIVSLVFLSIAHRANGVDDIEEARKIAKKDCKNSDRPEICVGVNTLLNVLQNDIEDPRIGQEERPPFFSEAKIKEGISPTRGDVGFNLDKRTALDIRQQQTAPDFVFDLQRSRPVNVGEAGSSQRAGIQELPGLRGLGVSSVLFRIEPCGINLPHLHPRGTELLHVLEGQFQTGFLEENTGRVIVNNLESGQVTFFPQGLVHFEQNLGCTNATFLSAFSNEDPGVLTITTRIFDLPQQSLTSSFNQPDDVINFLRRSVKSNPAKGRGECLRRCGIGK